MLLEVLQNELDGVSYLAAVVQLMVYLVKLSCFLFDSLASSSRPNDNFRLGSAFILRPASALS